MATATKMLAKKAPAKKAAPKVAPKVVAKKAAPKAPVQEEPAQEEYIEEYTDEVIEEVTDEITEEATGDGEIYEEVEEVVEEVKKPVAKKKIVAKKIAAKTSPKPAAKTVVKVPAGDIIATTSQQVEAMGKAQALKLAKDLLEQQTFNEFKLGGVLSVIQANGFWVDEVDSNGNPYAKFKDFMEAEYNIAYRTGMYFIGIYNALVESEIPWEKVKDVGWTKLKEIATLLTLDNVDEWVERALSMNTPSLIAYVKELGTAEPSGTGATTSGAEKLTTMTFKVHGDQKDTITAALEKSMKANGTDVNTVALEMICLNYLEGTTGKVKTIKVVKPLEEVLADMDIEEAFDIIGNVFHEYTINVSPIEEEEVTEDGTEEVVEEGAGEEM